jgi:hypothetical protein
MKMRMKQTARLKNKRSDVEKFGKDKDMAGP